jgi:hypothetical protein
VDLIERDRVKSLAAKVRALEGYPHFPGVEAGRARYDHMGALLADAALQAAIDFNSVVKPRVQRMLAAWPEADTVARFLVRVRAEGLHQVLDWTDAEKPSRAVRLADLLTDEGVDSVDELRNWSLRPGSRAKLLKLKGVGEKTADYIAMLAGAPVLAVDRRIRAFVGSGTDEQIRGLLTAVATDLDIDLGVLDRVVWAAGKEALPTDDRPDSVGVTIVVPADRAARFHDFAQLWLEGRAQAEWRATDHEKACALWRQLDDRRRRLLGVLIEQPGHRFSSKELMRRSGAATTPTGLVSLLSHLAGLSERLGRAWPWQYDYPQGKGKPAVYWFEPDVAEMFSKARVLVEDQDVAEAVN